MILITGATGFLGRHLLPHLAAKKEKVRCLARKTSDTNFIDREKFDLVFGDLSDMQSLISATKGIITVVNLAAATGGSAGEMHRTNVVGTKDLLEACRQNKVKRIVHISSMATARKPLDEYGKAKLAADKLVMESGLEWVILRPTIIYGKGSSAQKLLVSYVNALPFVIPIIGNGNYEVMPVYVEDVCSAIIGALDAKIRGKIYDIAGPDKVAFEQMLRVICKELGVRKAMLHIPVPVCIAVAKIFSVFPGFPIKESFIKSLNNNAEAEQASAIRDLGFHPVSFDKGIRLVM